jgi:uncharacterized phage protein gp47/JayE
MTFDRAKIMKAAWVIVRRFAGTKESLRSKLARALRNVWWDAKQAARVAAAAAARMAQRGPARAAAVIRAEIFAFECKDTLRGSDWATLDALHDELRRAAV